MDGWGVCKLAGKKNQGEEVEGVKTDAGIISYCEILGL